MPNWVNNSMTVSGAEADVRKFADKARKPYTTYYKGAWTENADGTKKYDADKIEERLHDSCISFMNFSTPEDLDAYYGASDYKPEGYETWTMEERLAHAFKHSSDGWYDWNVRNWGTKWDACDPELHREEYADGKGELAYSFNTAWSPADGAFEAMVAQHPELEFEFKCVEEQGWGVEFIGTDGELSVAKEWDIPSSHAEWLELEDECRACSWYEDGEDTEDLYDDCPAKQTASTDEAVGAFEDISELI